VREARVVTKGPCAMRRTTPPNVGGTPASEVFRLRRLTGAFAVGLAMWIAIGWSCLMIIEAVAHLRGRMP
jgi:hypothetical protein